jgi:ATP-binding cassette subfamily F protein uup
VGGYDDWQRQSQAENSAAPDEKQRKPGPSVRQEDSQPGSPRKLTYKEQRALEEQKKELAELPKRIETLEAEQHQLAAAMALPTFYQQDSAKIAQASNRLKELENELAQAYQRWEELEQL